MQRVWTLNPCLSGNLMKAMCQPMTRKSVVTHKVWEQAPAQTLITTNNLGCPSFVHLPTIPSILFSMPCALCSGAYCYVPAPLTHLMGLHALIALVTHFTYCTHFSRLLQINTNCSGCHRWSKLPSTFITLHDMP